MRARLAGSGAGRAASTNAQRSPSLLAVVFVVGYFAIALESTTRVNKAAPALVMGVACWTLASVGVEPRLVTERLAHHLGEIAQVLFFLLGAMTIVELIDAHDGFDVLTSRVKTRSRRGLIVTLGALAFLLSAVLDNLTASIVMVSLVRTLARDRDDRMVLAGTVIIAANAGGVWSPIGDVTTTMLWVGNQVSATRVITGLFLPALASVVVPLAIVAARTTGSVRRPFEHDDPDLAMARTSEEEDAGPGLDLTSVTLTSGAAAVGKTLASLDMRARTGATVVTITREGKALASPSPADPLLAGDVLALAGAPDARVAAMRLLVTGQAPKATSAVERRLVLVTGVAVLLLVPVFKAVTHLPPVMGILIGLGVLWTLTEAIHKDKNDAVRGGLTVSGALQRIDAQSILFFLGILLGVSALDAKGLLVSLAAFLDRSIGNEDVVTVLIGLSSSIVDNVPLVAAAQGMYPLASFPTDHRFWLFLGYCAGTGGSIFIIGSAAGVAVMGMERISFGWYLRRLTLPALLGYAAGVFVFFAIRAL